MGRGGRWEAAAGGAELSAALHRLAPGIPPELCTAARFSARWGASAPVSPLPPSSLQASQLGVYRAFVDNYKVAIEMAEKCCQANAQFAEISEVGGGSSDRAPAALRAGPALGVGPATQQNEARRPALVVCLSRFQMPLGGHRQPCPCRDPVVSRQGAAGVPPSPLLPPTPTRGQGLMLGLSQVPG